MIEIREATPDDAETLHKMLADKAKREGLSEEFTVTSQGLSDMIARKNSKTLIAFYNGQPASMANYHYEDSTFTGDTMINITDLYTSKVFGGKGLAKALLRHIARIALNEDVKLKLIPLTSNVEPIDWYLRLGARPSYEGTVLRVDDVDQFLANLG